MVTIGSVIFSRMGGRTRYAGAQPFEPPAHLRHSDKKKFRSLNRPENCKMSEWLLKTLRKFVDFQAEYEGSIPFTRSKAISMT